MADDASRDALNALLDAIEEYEADIEPDTFTETKEVTITDAYTDGGSYETEFAVPVEKIIIEEVTVDKY